MIRYALACDAGHDFDSWFRSSDDFETQAKRGFVTCPVCGSIRVEKQLMSPQVRRTDKSEPGQQDVVLVDPEAQALREKIAAFRAEVMSNSEDVGHRFAQEARDIHYGDAEKRSIRGQATMDDARALIEEGIDFLPIPELPDDRN